MCLRPYTQCENASFPLHGDNGYCGAERRFMASRQKPMGRGFTFTAGAAESVCLSERKARQMPFQRINVFLTIVCII